MNRNRVCEKVGGRLTSGGQLTGRGRLTGRGQLTVGCEFMSERQ